MSIETLKIPLKKNGCETFIKQGDTIHSILFNVGGFGEDLRTLHIIRMQLYNGQVKVVDLSSASEGGITITGEETFEIDKVIENDYPVGTMKGDLQIEKYVDFGFGPTEVTTLFNVEYTIIEQYTKIP